VSDLSGLLDQAKGLLRARQARAFKALDPWADKRHPFVLPCGQVARVF